MKIRCGSVAGLMFVLQIAAVQARDLILDPGQPFTAATLATLSASQLPIQPAGRRLTLRATWPQLPMNNPSLTNVFLDLVALEIDRDAGRFEAQLAVKTEGGPTAMMKLSGTVETEVEVPIVTVAVAAGSVISADQLDLDWIAQGRLPDDAIERADMIVGNEATRRLAGGRFLRAADVRPESLVRRGDLVSIVYRHKAVQISTFGRALTDGAKGAVVRVSNSDSGTELKAVVSGAKEVAVGTSAQ